MYSASLGHDGNKLLLNVNVLNEYLPMHVPNILDYE